MFRFLKRLLSLFFQRTRPAEPQDPHASVREPRPQRPGGRNTAVAVAEPEDRDPTRVVGRLE
jgi:hypothetical protein